MADLADIQSTFDSSFFKVACQDVARIVSILSLDSTDVTRPHYKKSLPTKIKDKFTFLSRFFYMVFVKGFTPTVFDILPYYVWLALTLLVYAYRAVVLPFWLRFTGYGRYADWKDIDSKQPPKDSAESKPLKKVSLTAETNLSRVDFGDPQYETFVAQLHKFTTHLSPHSQSPGNPLTHVGFPGNFFDHLTGCYKILLAWNQPQYVVRAGMFHSVYGTFDYRYSLYDLREGRHKLSGLIGSSAEEISFTICTSDRLGLLSDLLTPMYGSSLAKDILSGNYRRTNNKPANGDGNYYPPLIGQLSETGFKLRNHITQQYHVIPADLFAQFVIVMIADFMEQGAIPHGSADSDICLFQFLRFRFYNDLMQFVKPFVRYMPPVWEKYFGKNAFIEPTRREVVEFKKIWKLLQSRYEHYNEKSSNAHDKEGFMFTTLTKDNQLMILDMVKKYPYLSEPRVVLASTLTKSETIDGYTRDSLAKEAKSLIEEWGMLCVKSGEFNVKAVLNVIASLQK